MRVSNDVLNVLSNANTSGNSLFLMGQLDRAMYVSVNKVLEAAGGKWDRKSKSHIFDQDAETRVDEIILTGEVVIPKDEFDFFPTPPEIAQQVIELADISKGMLVLEPSAGEGALVDAAREAGGFVYVVEKNERMAIDLGARGFEWLAGMHCGDFMEFEPSQKFDRVVMNPPFSKQRDIKHVMHAHAMLKPDGLLVSIMSSSVTFRDNKLTQGFRELIRAKDGDILALPEGSFKASGTMVNTVIVTIPA